MDRAVARELSALLREKERPPMRQIIERLARFCRGHELRPPARATVYSFLERARASTFRKGVLPSEVAATLYNLDDEARVPGRQLVFYAMHHGSTAAISFAASLPWLDLYQASLLPGWRPGSRGLLESVMKVRKIRP